MKKQVRGVVSSESLAGHSLKRVLPELLLILVLAGCTVGPDFRTPADPEVVGYTTTPVAVNSVSAPTLLGDSQRLTPGADLHRQWWRMLGAAKLDPLLEEGLQNSPTLASAAATLRQAQEVFAARGGETLYPQIEGGLAGQRQRFNPGSLGQPGGAREFSLYSASVGVRYTLDLAGGNRRALEALAARIDYQLFQLEGAQLTLAAEIVTAAVTQARLATQIEATESILRSQEEQLGLTRERIRLGQAAADEESALQAQVEQTRASLPSLRLQRQQSEHLLAVLTGREPGAGGLPSFTLDDFTLPSDLPLVVPSDLVRARPDIQAAEALLQVANAEYGVAIANLYPQFTLSANLGSQALTTGALFGSGSAIWSLVGELTQPLFKPGLPAEKRAALAAFDEAAANYRQVVLESLRNVADVLRALENDSQRLAALASADAATQRFQDSTRRRYVLGAADYYEVLLAQQQSQQIRIDLAEAQAQRLLNSVAFFQAMGGGHLTGP